MKAHGAGGEGIRMRDVGALIACATAVFISLQFEGDFEIVHAHHMPLDTSLYTNGQFPEPYERLPRPVVADVDGDGQKEIVIATREPSIQVLRVPRGMKLREDDPPPPALVASATLLSFTRVSKGRHPIALAAGYLDPYDEKAGPRRQSIVVVTEDWTVLCYSHDLDLLWESTVAHLQDTLGLGALYHREVTALVVPTPIRDGDRGAVFVAGSLDLRHSHQSAEAAALGGDGEVWAQGGAHAADGGDEDGSGEFARLRNVDLGRVRSDVAPAGAEEEDLARWRLFQDKEGFLARLRKARHFSYYALEGGSGAVRWRHESGDFTEAVPGDAQLQNAFQYRMTAEAARAHAGEADWRVFRSDVMASLPHAWHGRDDTTLHAARFERRQRGRRTQGWTKGGETDHGHRFLGVPAGARAPHAEEEHVRDPNVLVAHTRHGVEAVHLWTGHPLCRLHLPDRGLWHDLNGDGILDVAHGVGRTAGGEEGEGRVAGRGARVAHTRLPSCFARVMTGVPPTEALFNGSLCAASGAVSDFAAASSFGGALAGERGGGGGGEDVEVAVPIALDRPTSLSGTVHQRVARASAAVHPHDAIFLTSAGTVTSYGPQGQLNWQTETAAGWETDAEWEESAMRPTLTALSLTDDALKSGDHALAAGQRAMALLDRSGRVVAAAPLRDAPVAAPVVEDVDGDDVHDLVVVTRRGVDVFLVRRSSLHKAVTAVVGVVILILVASALTFLGNQLSPPRRGGAYKRATE